MKGAELIRNVDSGVEMPQGSDALGLRVRASVALLGRRGVLAPHAGGVLATEARGGHKV